MKPGNAMPLAAMPIGTIVHNVEMKPGEGGQVARSAGSFVQLVGRDSGWAVLKLNSGETRKVSAECMATVGAVSNPDHINTVAGKAGRTRWQGTPSDGSLDRHEPGRPSRTVVVRRAASTGRRLGASRPRASRPARTRRPTKYIVRSRQKAKK